MAFRSHILAVTLMGALGASAQVASHGPTGMQAPVNSGGPTSTKPVSNLSPAEASAMAMKPVARVNGAVLNEVDLVREMYAIFPYAQQHNGFPKGLEPQIRKGALDMIVFEELLYQEGKRRNCSISPQRVASAEVAFRKQFATKALYDQYMQTVMKGDKAVLLEQIRRSLLIERMLKTEVTTKAQVTPLDAKASYLKNPQLYMHGETFRIQTISIIPPQTGGAEITKEARKRADDALRLAKATKTYREFGLLAEKMSDDDWHVSMGDRKVVERSKLPPEVVKVALSLKLGQVSDLIQIQNCYTVLRLVAHTPPGKTPFATVKVKLQSDMQKQKTQEVRAALGVKLRKTAKVELL